MSTIYYLTWPIILAVGAIGGLMLRVKFVPGINVTRPARLAPSPVKAELRR